MPVLAPILAALVLLLAAPAGTRAQPLPDRAEGDFVIRDFRLRSGEVLPELRQHYTTLGTPIRDAGGRIVNAVLLMHGSSGDAGQLLAPSFSGELFGPGQPLDAARHFLILPDALGNGGSTRPSDGLRGDFPKYGYHDMVTAQHRLITEHFGIERLRLVGGISMGGMHTWLWGIRYPEMMDALLPIAAQPVAIRGRNLVWRRILANAVRNDPGWNGGDYAETPHGFRVAMQMFDLLVQNPRTLEERATSYGAADAYLDEVDEETFTEDDANDILYRFEASFDYDPEPELERIRAPLLAILFEDDELNPPELGVMERVMPRVRNGRYLVLPPGPDSRGHRNQVQAAMWKAHLADFLDSLPPLPSR